MTLFSGTISTLEQALNYASTKQKVISNNIANVDTPNFKAQDVSFKQVLNEKLESLTVNRTDRRHFDFSMKNNTSTNIYTNNVSYNNSGNSVDIDKEMSNLATNQIYYNAVTERLSSKFQSIQNVVRGGR